MSRVQPEMRYPGRPTAKVREQIIEELGKLDDQARGPDVAQLYDFVDLALWAPDGILDFDANLEEPGLSELIARIAPHLEALVVAADGLRALLSPSPTSPDYARWARGKPWLELFDPLEATVQLLNLAASNETLADTADRVRAAVCLLFPISRLPPVMAFLEEVTVQPAAWRFVVAVCHYRYRNGLPTTVDWQPGADRKLKSVSDYARLIEATAKAFGISYEGASFRTLMLSYNRLRGGGRSPRPTALRDIRSRPPTQSRTGKQPT